MGRKVLFVSYDGLTDPLGQSQVLPYFIGLRKLGHQITILSCEKQEAFERNNKIVQKKCDQANISWKYVFYHKSPAVISTLIDLKRMKTFALKLNKEINFDIVHCRSVITTSIGQLLQKKGAAFIFDIRGFWADERVDGQLWSLSNPLYRFIYHYFKRKEHKAYQTANKIVTLTKAAKEVLLKSESLAAEKIAVVPCMADLEHYSVDSIQLALKEQLQHKLQINKDDLIIGYCGSLGTRYLIEEMLLCFKQINQKFPHSKYLIVTQNNTNQLEYLIAELDLKGKIIIASSTHAQMPTFLSLMDVALYFIYAGNSGKAVSPTKQAEFLSMGIPIITNSGIGDSKEIIADNSVGLVLDELDDENYKNVTELISEILKKDKIEIIKIAKDYFDLKKGIGIYHGLYESID